ncbi:MAG: CHAP domain-containing protein [Dehalococcoidia bacterium]
MQKILRMAFSLVAFLSLGLASAPPTANASPHWCECVEYVKSRFGLTGAAGDAKDMGPFLQRHGFRKVSAPQTGAVIIIQPAFFHSGSGAIYGHVGVIDGVASVDKGRTWAIAVHGSNQLGSMFNGSNCSNVTLSAKSILKTSHLATYWAPPHK